MTIIIDLPIPPSANNLFCTVGKRRVMTPKAKAYRQLVAVRLAVRGHRQHPPITGRVAVHITAHFENDRRRDIDNLAKALLDALTTARVWSDDSQVTDLHIQRGPNVCAFEPYVRVHISSITTD